MINSTDIASLS